MRDGLVLRGVWCVLLFLLWGAVGAAMQETPEPGFIVWASNRDGDWEIFRIRTDGTQRQQLTQNDLPDMAARVSPDGRFIAWTHGPEQKPEVWIMRSDGQAPQKLIFNAQMGEWRDEHTLIFFRGRQQQETYLYDLQNHQEQRIWPPDTKLEAHDIREARPSPDGQLFVGWAARPRGTWLFSRDGTLQKHVHSGCEGRFAPNGQFIYWVMTAGTFGKADLTGTPGDPLYVIPETEYGHTYFPRLSADMQWLIFSACPNDQHDHNTSDYEVFLMRMEDLKPAWDMPQRLTFDPGTDRWPDIFIYHDETPPGPPADLEAEVDGQWVKLTWSPVSDPETGIVAYRIYRGDERLAEVTGATAYLDRATAPRSRYEYRVTALNAAELEGSPSPQKHVKTKDGPPVPPVGLRADSADGAIRLRWKPNPETDVVQYRIYRSEEATGPFKRLPAVRRTTYQDSLVENGRRYYYLVTAVDRKGQESSRPQPAAGSSQIRVGDNPLVLYTFADGEGAEIRDRGGEAAQVDLEAVHPERVSWLKGGPGLGVTASTLIRSHGKTKALLDVLKRTSRLTVEAWIEPADLQQTGPARIFSMSANPVERNFTLGQMGANIAWRLRTTNTSTNGIPELDTSNRPLTESKTHLVATYDGEWSRLYLNGVPQGDGLRLGGDFSNWQEFPLLLANEATEDRPWQGRIYLIAIYGRALSPQEILQNYQAGLPYGEGSPIHVRPLDGHHGRAK